jgi:hypothetical protein
MLLLILCGLLIATDRIELGVVLDASYADDDGEDLVEDDFDLSVSEFELDETSISPESLPDISDSMAAPQLTSPTGVAPVFVPPSDTTSIGLALTGREAGMKEALLKAYGGTQGTEGAVALGLRWLASKQRADGLWSLRGPYSDGANSENEVAATAMALLAFQGAGYTHKGDRSQPYTLVVYRGWRALLNKMDENGNFVQSGPYSHAIYSQAQCTIALCELYGMTRDPDFREPAQRAVDYLVKIQTPEGGWRYQPGQGSDMSVTGWVVMALQSARMAGLEVPSETFERVNRFLDSVAHDYGSKYSYLPNEGFRLSLTPEGLLCRQYLGWARNDTRLIEGVQYVLQNPPSFERGQQNVYYWYYATQVCHHMEGDYWQQWNNVMREVLPDAQVKRGKERGSWDPLGDRWGTQGGRLYVTCLSIYILEVYYRHLPIYSHDSFTSGF